MCKNAGADLVRTITSNIIHQTFSNIFFFKQFSSLEFDGVRIMMRLQEIELVNYQAPSWDRALFDTDIGPEIGVG